MRKLAALLFAVGVASAQVTTPVNTNLQLFGYVDATGATASSPFVYNQNPTGACGAAPAYQWAVDSTGQLHWCNPATLQWAIYPGAIGSQSISATGSSVLTPGALADGSLTTVGTLMATGAVVGSTVGAYPQPPLPAGVIDFEKVTAPNTITVYVLNESGQPQTIGATLFSVTVAGGGGIAAPTSGTVSPGLLNQIAIYPSNNSTQVIGHTLVAADIPALNYQSPVNFETNNVSLQSTAAINYLNSNATNGLTLTFTNSFAGNIQLGVAGMGPTVFTNTGLNETCSITQGSYVCGYLMNGVNALWQDSTNSNTFVGPTNAPTTLNGGIRNVALGGGLNVATTAQRNIAIGPTTLRGCTTCTFSVSIGDNSLFGAPGSTENTSVGASNMASATGSFNSSFAYNCLGGGSNSGSYNACFGINGMETLTSGIQNAGFGSNNMFYAGTANDTAALGSFTCAADYSGQNDTCIGYFAGSPAGAVAAQSGVSNSTTTVTFASTTGFSTGMNFFGPGVQAGTTISTVNVNTSVVLSLATTTSGTNIYYAASNALTSGSNDTFLGANTGIPSATQPSFVTVIGAGALAGCTSNCISLGRQGTTSNSSDMVMLNGLFTLSSGTGNPALPAASTVPQACAWIADGASTPTYLRTETGAGAVKVLVCSNGTNWQDH